MQKKKDILVEVSARHVHLTQEAVNILFGKGTELEPRKELTQAGLFACKQRVDIEGAKKTIEGVTILAPIRKYNQIEISKTEARMLGVEPPVRMSGDIEGSAGCTLIGPAGRLELYEGVIVPRRHIHMNSKDAEEYGIESNDCVSLEIEEEEGRRLILHDVMTRVSPKVSTFVHIDTDEGNAAGIKKAAYGRIVDIDKKEKE